MRYVVLIYAQDSDSLGAAWLPSVQAWSALGRSFHGQRSVRAASLLHPATSAQCVRVCDGQMVVTPGPYAETAEQLAGALLIDVDHLDQAISLAAQLPGATTGTVEIRPLVELAELPPAGSDVRDPQLKLYMLLCYDNEAAWNDVGSDGLRAAMLEAVAITHELAANGRYRLASPLQSVAMATSVRVRDGRTVVTDGPFAETREFLGGFYWIYAADVGEALAVAMRHPGLRFGSVEVRLVSQFANAVDSPFTLGNTW